MVKQIIKKITPSFLLDFYYYFVAFLGAVFFGFPSRRIFVLGVTGTKGKSTVLELINAILETAGKKTALLSSIRIKVDKESRKNLLGNTMPGRAFIQRFLRQAVQAGCDYALIEVTSQGILQHRHRFIKWDAALFTNLAPEHIEAHSGFENYREAKLSFFRYVSALKPNPQNLKPKFFFINKDDPNAEYFREAAKNGRLNLYSQGSDFNQDNIAAAMVFSRSQKISDDDIKRALENFPGVPGRMEIIQTEPFRVIIDYAHTPDSLRKVYQILKSNLICVLGSAGGGRDKWKRPKMGEIAGQYCREIILTNEDPYDENPGQILSEIKSGISNFQFFSLRETSLREAIPNLYEILDRREAIKKALSLAKKGDTVIITGKGCEPWLYLAKGKKMPWDEKEIVKEILSDPNLRIASE